MGIGPGGKDQITTEVSKVIDKCEVIIGYRTYIDLLRKMGLLEGKEIFSSPMKRELTRAKQAIGIALSGKEVVMVSNGDPGIYGMAGLVLEIMKKENISLEIEIIPGMPAFCAVSSLLGAPLMSDFALVSLSDLLTSFDLIEKRIKHAVEADFVIILYNPSSKSRKQQIKKVNDILLEYKDHKTPVGIVWNAKREGQKVVITTLEKMLNYEIDMSATIIIGNSSTFVFDSYMITKRGYKI